VLDPLLDDFDFDVLVYIIAAWAEFQSETYFSTQLLYCLLACRRGHLDSANFWAFVSKRPLTVAST